MRNCAGKCKCWMLPDAKSGLNAGPNANARVVSLQWAERPGKERIKLSVYVLRKGERVPRIHGPCTKKKMRVL